MPKLCRKEQQDPAIDTLSLLGWPAIYTYGSEVNNLGI